MNRFYYEYCELEDDTWEYVVFDRRLGRHIALCVHDVDAEKIVAALIAADKKPSAGIFD